jgi:hypothetical protein
VLGCQNLGTIAAGGVPNRRGSARGVDREDVAQGEEKDLIQDTYHRSNAAKFTVAHCAGTEGMLCVVR